MTGGFFVEEGLQHLSVRQSAHMLATKVLRRFSSGKKRANRVFDPKLQTRSKT